MRTTLGNFGSKEVTYIPVMDNEHFAYEVMMSYYSAGDYGYKLIGKTTEAQLTLNRLKESNWTFGHGSKWGVHKAARTAIHELSEKLKGAKQ